MKTIKYITRKVRMGLPFCLFAFLPSSVAAQTFTERLQQPRNGQGKVTVHQDASIDALVNGPATATPPAQRQPSNGNRQGQQRQQGGESSRQQNSDSRQQTDDSRQQARQTPTNTQAADTADTQGPRRTRKVIGYRIQAFVGGKTRADRQKAEQVGNTLRSLFPGHTVYVHFFSPRWICRIGNYRTYDEAKEMLDEVVRAGYPSATIVKGKITVTY